MNILRRTGLIGLSFLVLLGLGCGGGDANISISGTVTWEGKEIPDGRIVFEDNDSKTPPASAEIKAGKYQVSLPPGMKKVRIVATREKPGAKPDPAMGGVPREAYIPKQYNSETTLTADVKKDGKTQFDFPLKP